MVPGNIIGTADETLQKRGQYDNCSGNCTRPVPPIIRVVGSWGTIGMMEHYREAPGVPVPS